MGKAQKVKGATYEREVAGALRDALGVSVTRRLGQARDGGHDLHLPGFVPECKRRASFVAHGFMRQAEMAATSSSGVPVVFARGDGEQTLVIMRLNDWVEYVREDIVASALAEQAAQDHTRAQSSLDTHEGDA